MDKALRLFIELQPLNVYDKSDTKSILSNWKNVYSNKEDALKVYEVDSKEREIEVIEEITDNLIQRIVELNVDLPLSTLKERIGDKIAMVKWKKEASLSEIQNTFSLHIKNYLEKIENTKL